jgi:hypothetical protein
LTVASSGEPSSAVAVRVIAEYGRHGSADLWRGCISAHPDADAQFVNPLGDRYLVTPNAWTRVGRFSSAGRCCT